MAESSAVIKDQSSSLPQKHSKTQELFLSLQNEWENQSTSFVERFNWTTLLKGQYGPRFVEKFFEWLDKDYSRDDYEDISKEEFATSLRSVRWNISGRCLSKVNTRLWHPCMFIEPDFCLGNYEGTPLSLHLNGRALGPQETESEICEFYDITAINIGPLFGIRYKAGDEGTEYRDFLFVPLGNVYSARQQSSTKSRSWKDTGFIWILEILSSGLPHGLYVLYNFARQDSCREIERNRVNELVPRFCNAQDSFTLAKVSPDIMSAVKSGGSLESPGREIGLKSLCKLKPEIVETGLKKEAWSDGHPPIPLFLPSEMKR